MKYITYPIVVILTMYLMCALDNISFNVRCWTSNCRDMFCVFSVIAVFISLATRLWNLSMEDSY